MSREVEKDYEKIFQTKVCTSIVEENRKLSSLAGLRYLEVERVGHAALNLGLHILHTFLVFTDLSFLFLTYN